MSELLAQRVAELDWYHTMDLPGGVVTPGLFDHRPVLGNYDLPDDLSGLRVLDVGTFDGSFAFEFERRGAAEVVAIDLADREDLDWPAPLRRSGVSRFNPRRTNFDLAKEALGSSVRHEICSAYDASPERLGMFDYVFVGSLLVHLRDPVGALASLLTVTKDTIHLGEHTHRSLEIRPAARFEALGPHLTWWVPNNACLRGWLLAAGFVDVNLGSSFIVPFRGRRGGIRHTVARGHRP